MVSKMAPTSRQFSDQLHYQTQRLASLVHVAHSYWQPLAIPACLLMGHANKEVAVDKVFFMSDVGWLVYSNTQDPRYSYAAPPPARLKGGATRPK